MSQPATELLGSLWRDETGNTYRVYSIHHMDDPDLRLVYVPPPRVKALSLSELQASHSSVSGDSGQA